jgi:N-acetylglucosaminyldiphosphoundecaprenol N-acetyl-beta-D-mannosaminyltransferase
MQLSRFNFLGISISRINLSLAIGEVKNYSFQQPAYICFPDASVVQEANKDPLLKNILNSAYLTMPDGKPSQLAGKLQGYKEVSTVSGFHLCKALLNTELSHYFYGGTEELLEKLKANLESTFPKARILGYSAPPFVKKEDIGSSAKISRDIEAIKQLKPDLVWIGISSPKQDYLMHHFYQELDKSLMLGVGGVFLYLADESLKSPEWVKKIGMRWAYRLLKEPKRLWPKYYATMKFLLQNRSFFFKLLLRKKETAA